MSTINTNVVSLNAQRNLATSQSSLAQSMQRLSSGLLINSARDDAAGLAIAERMRSQVNGMNVAMRNANDGISLAQTAEGALGKVGDILQRMRELAVQSANGTNSAGDRTNLNQEYAQLASEVSRQLGGTQFNGTNILASTVTTATSFQIGSGTSANDTLTIASVNLTGTVGAGSTINAAVGTSATISTAAGATTAMQNIDAAIDAVNSQRATFGAVQNRFEAIVNNLQISSENQAAARARIMDADYAAETANLSRSQILQQAGNAMVAQANQLPSQVLSLLR